MGATKYISTKNLTTSDMEIKNVMLMPCVTHAMSQQAASYG